MHIILLLVPSLFHLHDLLLKYSKLRFSVQ